VLYVNGKKTSASGAAPDTTLLDFLRNNKKLTGTKLGKHSASVLSVLGNALRSTGSDGMAACVAL